MTIGDRLLSNSAAESDALQSALLRRASHSAPRRERYVARAWR